MATSLHGRHVHDRAPYQFILKPTSLGLNMTFNKNLIPTVEVHSIIDLPALQLCITRPQVLTILHLKEVSHHTHGASDQMYHNTDHTLTHRRTCCSSLHTLMVLLLTILLSYLASASPCVRAGQAASPPRADRLRDEALHVSVQAHAERAVAAGAG